MQTSHSEPAGPTYTESAGSHRHRGPRAAKHERLQREASRFRGVAWPMSCRSRCEHDIHRRIRTFVTTAIPLAGCLTPQALARRRYEGVPGFKCSPAKGTDAGWCKAALSTHPDSVWPDEVAP